MILVHIHHFNVCEVYLNFKTKCFIILLIQYNRGPVQKRTE